MGTTERFEETSDDLELQYDKSRELNDRLIAEIKSLRVGRRAAEETAIAGYKRQVDKARIESDTIHAELIDTQKKLMGSRQQLAALQDELGRSERREAERCSEIKVLQAELGTSGQTREQLTTLQAQMRELERQLEADEAIRMAQLHQIETLEDEKNATARLVDRTRADMETRLTTLNDIKHDNDELERLRQEHGICSSKRKELEKELESTRRTAMVAKEELTKCRDQLQHARKQSVNQEYLRNVVLSFLRTPSQRQYMLDILARLLQFTEEERNGIQV